MSEMFRSFESDFIKYLNSVRRKAVMLNTLTIGQF